MDALFASGGAAVGASALAFHVLGSRKPRPLAALELSFGTDLRREPVEALLAAISGLSPNSAIVLETIATEVGIRHLLRAEQATLDTISGQLRVLIPSTRIEPLKTDPAHDWRMGARLTWSGRHVVLRADGASESTAGLLAALGPLARDEAMLVRVVLQPGRPRPLPEPRRSTDHKTSSLFGTGPHVEAHQLTTLRAKYAAPVLHTDVLIAVACGHPGRGTHLLGRVTAVFRSRRSARGQLLVRRLNGQAVQRTLGRRPRRGVLLSPAELSGLISWPIDAPRLPGLQLGSAPLLFPDRRIPTSGRMLGRSTWPGMETRGLAQPAAGSLSHTLLCGPTGSGKSGLLANLVVADLKEGRGCLVLDGKGDLVEDLLARIPEHRMHDVILLDPASPGPVPGLRVFGQGSDPELAADVALNVMREIFKDSFGVRSAQWLRAGLVTIAHDPEGSLGDLPFLFSDDAYRRRLVGKLRDPLLQATWAAYEAMSAGERSNQLGAPLNRLGELLGRRVLRTVLSQPSPTLDFAEVLRHGRVVLVSVSPGQLGGPASRLLGALVLHAFFSAVQARTAIPPAKRTPFALVIDEPRVLADIPVPLDGLLERARGNAVGVTIATQSLSTLPNTVKSAALTNSATLLALRQTADDAELLARQLPGVTAEGLQGLGAFEFIARIGLGAGEVSAPVSGRTLPPPAATSDPEQVRRLAAERYGADPTLVDQALAERHGHPGNAADAIGEVPVGRKRRTR